MRTTTRRLFFLGLVLFTAAFAGALPPRASAVASCNCGFGFHCCIYIQHTLCWPNGRICPVG